MLRRLIQRLVPWWQRRALVSAPAAGTAPVSPQVPPHPWPTQTRVRLISTGRAFAHLHGRPGTITDIQLPIGRTWIACTYAVTLDDYVDDWGATHIWVEASDLILLDAPAGA